MILVDTSVWIDHLRKEDPTLTRCLRECKASSHPFVIGELAVGKFRNRERILEEMAALPLATPAEDDEVLRFITRHQLHGIGIGYIDVHLLAATQLSSNTLLWTRDKRLGEAARGLLLDFKEPIPS